MNTPDRTNQPSVSDQVPIQIRSDGEQIVVFTPEDYDRFVETQPEVIRAVRTAQQERETEQSIQQRLGSFVAGLTYWCKKHPVDLCVISPRMDDIMVVIVAADDDPGGQLHDEMSRFDLSNFEDNHLRIFWLMLRRSEAAGLSSFVDMRSARVVYNANKKTA